MGYTRKVCFRYFVSGRLFSRFPARWALTTACFFHCMNYPTSICGLVVTPVNIQISPYLKMVPTPHHIAVASIENNSDHGKCKWTRFWTDSFGTSIFKTQVSDSVVYIQAVLPACTCWQMLTAKRHFNAAYGQTLSPMLYTHEAGSVSS